jgi:hypothetical protein
VDNPKPDFPIRKRGGVASEPEIATLSMQYMKPTSPAPTPSELDDLRLRRLSMLCESMERTTQLRPRSPERSARRSLRNDPVRKMMNFEVKVKIGWVSRGGGETQEHGFARRRCSAQLKPDDDAGNGYGRHD